MTILNSSSNMNKLLAFTSYLNHLFEPSLREVPAPILNFIFSCECEFAGTSTLHIPVSLFNQTPEHAEDQWSPVNAHLTSGPGISTIEAILTIFDIAVK